MAYPVKFKDALDAWRPAALPDDASHVATSALFDLMQQRLSAREKPQVLQHLAVCSACAHTLKDLMQQSGEVPVMLVETPRLAAQRPVDEGCAAPPSDTTLLITEDESRKVQFIRSVHDESTFLTIEVKPDYRQEFEGKEVQVYDTQGTRLCHGQVVGGVVTWHLAQTITGRILVKVQHDQR